VLKADVMNIRDQATDTATCVFVHFLAFCLNFILILRYKTRLPAVATDYTASLPANEDHEFVQDKECPQLP